MREYETILVLDAALDGEGVEAEVNRVVKMIEDKKGEVREVQRWGRRRLSYPIKKKSDGVYTYIRFGGNTDVLSEIDRRCSLNESMLRFMTVAIEHPLAANARPSFAQETTEAEPARSASPGRPERKSESAPQESPARATEPAAAATGAAPEDEAKTSESDS